jgi:hypothetical protein
MAKKIKISSKSKDVVIPVHIAPESDWQKLLKQKQAQDKASKIKNNLVKGYKPGDNRQVTHNLRRRMGR